jgi:uncharacterized protein (DUF1330 family)
VSAYIIADVLVKDPVEYENYKRQTPSSIARYGGRFVVRGGRAESLEGDWQPNRIVVLEFPSLDQAKKWWACEEYAPVKAIRLRTASSRLIVVEGVDSITS